jgi:Zn-dependent metalloprotease
MRRLVTVSTVTIIASVAAIGGAGAAQATPARLGARSDTVSTATEVLAAHRALAKAGADDVFTARRSSTDRDGTAHVRYERTHRGLAVLGGDVIVHSKAGTLKTMSVTLAKPLSVATKPAVPAARATAAATAQVHGDGPASAPTLAVDAANTPALVWQTTVPGVVDAEGDKSNYVVLVDAGTGKVRDAWPTHQAGTGTGFAVGPVALTTTKTSSGYELRDGARGGTYTADAGNANRVFTDADDVWGDGALANRQTVAVDAHYGVAQTWDYYRNVHGRSGIAGDGRGSYSVVHFGTNFKNAFWDDDCFCMTYGDGDGVTMNPLVSLDVAGHEMSHGVTSTTAALRYSGESGGLNESTSDIFGTMVEFYANNPKDKPDYLIGETILKNGRPLRYLDDPKKDGNSASCYTAGVGNLDVHFSSGVGNHFFFNLAVGTGARTVGGVAYNSPVCNGAPAMTGIGNAAAEKIYYRALTTYMTSTTNYQGARAATLSAATDLYGSTSAQYQAVAAAWTAVGVN